MTVKELIKILNEEKDKKAPVIFRVRGSFSSEILFTLNVREKYGMERTLITIEEEGDGYYY